MSGGGGGCRTHHNYQGCRSDEAPDEVRVQAEPAAVGREAEIRAEDGNKKQDFPAVSVEDNPPPGPQSPHNLD